MPRVTTCERAVNNVAVPRSSTAFDFGASRLTGQRQVRGAFAGFALEGSQWMRGDETCRVVMHRFREACTLMVLLKFMRESLRKNEVR